MAQLCSVALSNDAHGNLVATKIDSGISTLSVPRESIFHEGDTVTVKIVAESSGNVTLTPLYPPDPQLSRALLPFLPSLGSVRCPGNGRPIPIPRAQSAVPATVPALVPLCSQAASQHKQADDTSTCRLTPGEDSSRTCSRFTVQPERPLSINESRKAHSESLAHNHLPTQKPETQHADHVLGDVRDTEHFGGKGVSEDGFRERNAIVLDDCMPNGSQYADKVIHTERQQAVEMSEYLVFPARNGDINANVESDDSTENFKNNYINNISETKSPERASGDLSGIKTIQNSQFEEDTIVIDKHTTVTGNPRFFEGESVGASAVRGRVQASNTDDKGGGTQDCHGPNRRSRAERMESRGWVKVLRPADAEQRRFDKTRARGGSADDSEDWILVDRTMLNLLAAWQMTSKR